MGLLDEVADHAQRLRASLASAPTRAADADQPVHTLYVPADQIHGDTITRAEEQARTALARSAPTPEALTSALDAGHVPGPRTALQKARDVAPAAWDAGVWLRTKERIDNHPIEDLRIDFEDGYGRRADDEEDEHAVAAARAVSYWLADRPACPRIGIRVKPLEPASMDRAAATLEHFIEALVRWPDDLVVTVPKVTRPEQVALADALLAAVERRLGRPAGSIRLEAMVETTTGLVDASGRSPIPACIDAGTPRLLGIHLGVYDFTASCLLPPGQQSPEHNLCRLARSMLRFAAGDRVHLSDGASNVLPVGNPDEIHAAWRIGYRLVAAALADGIPQGWDMHPAQLIPRHAANIAFYRRDYASVAKRLAALLEQATKPGADTVHGAVIDEPATGQALLRAVSRAWRVGALTESELARSSLTPAEAKMTSFNALVAARRTR